MISQMNFRRPLKLCELAGWRPSKVLRPWYVGASLPSTTQTMINVVFIQSALLGGIEAGLLVFFHDDINFGAPHPSCRCNGPDWITTTPQKCTLILTYLSLVLSLAVTVTSYALTAEFSILPSRAARDNLLINSPPGSIRGSNWDILRHYGLRSRMYFLWRFCRNSI